MLGMGFVKNWFGFMCVCWFFGFIEVGFFFGVNYYFLCWYKCFEFGLCVVVFFLVVVLFGLFGGLFVVVIENMYGIVGFLGWVWIFILEGFFIIIVGIMFFWLVYDFFIEVKFLFEVDRVRVVRRLKFDK